MRTLAIGDIHGCAFPLDTLLGAVSPASDDTVITLGDYVDRGPDSAGVLDRLLALSQDLQLIALRGNHDQMMLDARDDVRAKRDWTSVGGDATLRSYRSLSRVPTTHWHFLETQCVDYWETETHFFVHGGVYPDLPLREQPRAILYWRRFDQAAPHQSGKVMVCGHTAQTDGLPRSIGHAVCLDTFAYGGGWLSCLDVGTGLVWQADALGQTRRLRLDECPEG